MSKSSVSVLQSLTATYTDSEGEEDDRCDRKRRSSSLTSDTNTDMEKEPVVTTTVATPESNKSGTNTPQSGSSVSGNLNQNLFFILILAKISKLIFSC